MNARVFPLKFLLSQTGIKCFSVLVIVEKNAGIEEDMDWMDLVKVLLKYLNS